MICGDKHGNVPHITFSTDTNNLTTQIPARKLSSSNLIQFTLDKAFIQLLAILPSIYVAIALRNVPFQYCVVNNASMRFQGADREPGARILFICRMSRGRYIKPAHALPAPFSITLDRRKLPRHEASLTAN